MTYSITGRFAVVRTGYDGNGFHQTIIMNIDDGRKPAKINVHGYEAKPGQLLFFDSRYSVADEA